MDQAEKIAHVVGGAMFGALASGGLVIYGFFAAAIMEKSLWLPAGILFGSAFVGGLLGGLVGRPFIDWMEEHWSQFWRHRGGYD